MTNCVIPPDINNNSRWNRSNVYNIINLNAHFFFIGGLIWKISRIVFMLWFGFVVSFGFLLVAQQLHIWADLYIYLLTKAMCE